MKPTKTESGSVAFKARSSLMSLRQRALFLLCDGNRTTDAVLAATGAVDAAREDLEHLVSQGFLVIEALPSTAQAQAPVVSVRPVAATALPASEGKPKDKGLYVDSWTMF